MQSEDQNRHHLLVRSAVTGRRFSLFFIALSVAFSTTSTIESSFAEELTAIEALSQLETIGRAPKTGYGRFLFGTPWSDVDRNGCDTRNDILQRDLLEIVFSEDQCVILRGILIDPFSGERINFERGRVSSLAVQIDHVVSLSNAWQTGAFRWVSEKRRQFANDPLNLLAVKGSLNAQKGDGDAATWLPPLKSYRCEYVARQIAVKSKYQLRVTPPEKSAMEGILASCPNQKLPEGSR